MAKPGSIILPGFYIRAYAFSLLLFMEKIKRTIRTKCNKYAVEIVISVVCLFISCLPAMSPEIPFGHDTPFHLARIEWLAESIKHGQFPAMVEPGWLNGMGYAVGVFYGDIVLYPAAILRMFGNSLHICYIFEILFINTLTLVSSYYVFQKIFPLWHAGIIGATAYMMTVYRLADIYTRGALAEAAAFSFLPLVILGIWKIFRSEKKGYLWLALGMTLLIQTHLITVLSTVIFLGIYCLFRIRETLRRNVLAEIGKSIVLAILLNLYFFVPLFQYLTETVSVDASKNLKDLSVYRLFPGQLFTLGYEATGWVHTVQSMKGEMPQTIGLTLLLSFAVSIIVLFKTKFDEHARLTVINLLICFLGLYVSSIYMPYDMIERKLPGIYRVLQYLQFPARILTIVAIMVPLLILYSLGEMLKHANKQIALLFALIVVGISLFQGQDFIGKFCATADMVSYDSRPEEISIPDNNWEYMPGTAEKDHLNYSVVTTEGTEAAIIQQDGLNWQLSVETNKNPDQWIDLPVLCYPGYIAWTERGDFVELTDNGKGQIRLLLSNVDYGKHIISVSFRQPFLWRISQVVSLMTLLALLYHSFRKNNAGTKYAPFSENQNMDQMESAEGV